MTLADEIKSASGHQLPRLVIGMALKTEKASKHVSQTLIDYAAKRGIELKIIDEHRPLEEQGHFDVIMQKIRRREWEEDLEAYAQRHPEVRVHDMPAATYPLRNRGTMLAPLPLANGCLLRPPDGGLPVRCTIPKHTMLEAGLQLDAAKARLAACGIAYPMLAKSLWADGRPSSHTLAVIHSVEGLEQVLAGPPPAPDFAPPLLFEQYVDHGTCLFKVYVIGDQEVMVTRPSLNLALRATPPTMVAESPLLDQTLTEKVAERAETTSITVVKVDFEGGNGGCGNGGDEMAGSSPPTPSFIDLAAIHVPPPPLEVISHRVSAYPSSRSWGKEDLAPKGHGVPPPPEWLFRGLAALLREVLGLTLFNFDLIVPLAPPPSQRGLLLSAKSGGEIEVEGEAEGVEEGLVHLIDINYFPGIEKLPNYEALLVRFFESLRR